MIQRAKLFFQAIGFFGLILASAFLSKESQGAERIKVLIIDGQNNHDFWPKTTMMMKRYFEESGLFSVDIARTKYTWKGDQWLDKYPLNDGVQREALKDPKADPDFAPEFSKYQVVVSNFGNAAADWPEKTRVAFEKFVADGGGFVAVHAADNSFGNWKEYNLMTGLGGWGGRNDKSGLYVFYDESGKMVRDNSPGKVGSHGKQHPFEVVIRDAEHPITKGLPRNWIHAQDELYDNLRGPAESMNVLATAFAAKSFGGTNRHEPVAMTIDYKKGRIFHSPLGHADYSFECVGFITLLLRGTEWAATGAVTQQTVPSDFPTIDKESKRKFDGP
jgi:type 1 glutamine amidotransferase